MIWQNSQVKQLVWENQQFTPVPEELLNRKLFIWNINFDSKDNNKDFDRFVSGQKTLHVDYANEYISGRISTTNLEWGNSENSFDAMFTNNSTITVFTDKEYDLDGKLVTIGNDRTFFFAKSFVTNQQIGDESYISRIELIKVQYYIENIVNDGIVGFPYNIMIGKFGQKNMVVPSVEWDNINKIETVKTSFVDNFLPDRFEVYIPEANAIGGIDFLDSGDNFITAEEIVYDNIDNYPEHNEYTLAPTQFKVFSLDNYGISGEGDITNTVKSLMFTQQLGQTIGNASNLIGKDNNVVDSLSELIPGGAAARTGILKASTFFTNTSTIGGAFFSDRSKLATQSALLTKQLTDDSSYLKLFFEEDMFGSGLDRLGYIDYNALKIGTLEINRSKGTSEVGASNLLPEGVDPSTVFQSYFKNAVSSGVIGRGNIKKAYNIVGKDGIVYPNSPNRKHCPALFAPNSTNYPIDNSKFSDFMRVGAPRVVGDKYGYSPIVSQNRWEQFVRSNRFRPDAYSWWNIPLLYPSSVINVYRTDNPGNSVTYDSGLPGNATSTMQHWTTGITVGKITNNESVDKRKSFTSFRVEFSTGKNVERLEMMVLTASEFKVMAISGNEKREFRFASTGYNSGTAADYINILEF